MRQNPRPNGMGHLYSPQFWAVLFVPGKRPKEIGHIHWLKLLQGTGTGLH